MLLTLLSAPLHQVRFAERIKHNLRKVKALDYLAALVAAAHDSLQAVLVPGQPPAAPEVGR